MVSYVSPMTSILTMKPIINAHSYLEKKRRLLNSFNPYITTILTSRSKPIM